MYFFFYQLLEEAGFLGPKLQLRTEKHAIQGKLKQKKTTEITEESLNLEPLLLDRKDKFFELVKAPFPEPFTSSSSHVDIGVQLSLLST